VLLGGGKNNRPQQTSSGCVSVVTSIGVVIVIVSAALIIGFLVFKSAPNLSIIVEAVKQIGTFSPPTIGELINTGSIIICFIIVSSGAAFEFGISIIYFTIQRFGLSLQEKPHVPRAGSPLALFACTLIALLLSVGMVLKFYTKSLA